MRRTNGRTRWVMLALVCVGIAAGSLAVADAAQFDPWGWIVWGREVLHLDLNTVQGPSWKPGAVLFTTVFALFGGLAPSLWVLTVRAGAILAVVMAYRISARLGGRFAGAVSAVLVLVMPGLLIGSMYGDAEPLMVGLLLSAIDRALVGARRAALILLLLASLLRPEVWPMFGAYSLYLWLKTPVRKVWVIGSCALLPVLWFGGDWWGSGNPFLSSQKAKQFVLLNHYAHFSKPALQTFKVAGDFIHRPALVLAVGAVGIAIVLRDRVVLILTAIALSMLLTVAIMAQDGYPVLNRFLLGTLALVFVLSGVGAGSIVRLLTRQHTALAIAAAAAIVAILSPLTISNARALNPGIRGARQWSDQINGLPQAVAAAGGRARVLACRGSITTYFLMTPALAWDLGIHMQRVVTTRHGAAGIAFVREHGPLPTIIRKAKRPRLRTLGDAAGWRALEIATPSHLNPC